MHADGTVTTTYDRATSESFSYFTGGGETNPEAWIEHTTTSGSHPEATTTYFLADQIHSTRMTLAYGGWPMTQDTYYPFGVEPNPPASPNHYKFSGKERDAASGLDDFGARYYSAVMGRFMTPDWSASPEPVPYAKLDNPQTLNLYTYVENNPLTGIDADGHLTLGPNGGFCGTSGTGIRPSMWTSGSDFVLNLVPCANSGLMAGVGQRIGNAVHGWLGKHPGVQKWLQSRHPELAAMLTRYMGKDEATGALKTGTIPNVGKNKIPRPTYFTKDEPINDAAAAKPKYELPEEPTHRATVPEDRVPNARIPEDGPFTSGGGTQVITDDPVQVFPDEISPLDMPIEIPFFY